MAKGEYEIKELYQGGYSTLDPKKNEYFSGYNAVAGKLGITTDPRTANIIKDASAKLGAGTKHIELAIIDQKVLNAIPKQQFTEVRRLAKLTGSEVSVHGPVMDSMGVTREGFSELNRKDSERRMIDVVARSHELNPNGNVPVVFHSAEGALGSEWEKIPDSSLGQEGKAKRLIVVEKGSGRMLGLDQDIKYYPGEKEEAIPFIKKDVRSPEQMLNVQNHSMWRNEIEQLIFSKERADEILTKNEFQIRHLLDDLRARRIDLENLTPTQKTAWINFQTANTYLEDINSKLNSQFSKAYEFGTNEQKQELRKLSEEYSKDAERYPGDILGHSKAMANFMLELKDSKFAPDILVPIEKFAVEQSSKTFGNTAFESYKKFGNNAPIIMIENPPVGFALSTGEDLRNLVKSSREEFVKKLVEEKGVDKKDVNKIAERFIGAVWDVGHINMLKGKGFSDKEILKETEKIAPFVKHVHLSDNFGFEHTELPMGMGNVPMKEIMKKLGQKGFEAKKIIEAGDWWQHFQTNPVRESLEGLGSPIYSDGVGPYWNQTLGFQQGYMGGYGTMLPSINYETFGAGFARLPKELGGRAGTGAGGRMGGGRD